MSCIKSKWRKIISIFLLKQFAFFRFFSPLVMITVSMLSVSKAGTRFPNRPSHLFERFRCNQNQHLNNNLSVIDATVGRFFSRNFHTLSIFHLFARKKMCTAHTCARSLNWYQKELKISWRKDYEKMQYNFGDLENYRRKWCMIEWNELRLIIVFLLPVLHWLIESHHL